MPARGRHGLVEQARAHGALGVVEAKRRRDEARGGGGGGSGSGSHTRSSFGVGKQSLLGPLQARDGLGGARVEFQGVQEGRARVHKPLQQTQSVPGARRGRGPQRRQRASAAGIPEGELGEVRRI